TSPKAIIEVKPSLIGKKKPSAAKKGLRAKKGLGAQKVSSQSFSEIEKKAQVAEKLREQQAAELRKEAEESLVSSMRLAYQELQIDRKKEEKKLQTLEGKKREQAERLGMGLASRSSISHSVLSEMHVIEQETPITTKSYRSQLDFMEDASFTSGPPKYKDNPFSLGEGFSPRWETEISTWGSTDKAEEEREVTISSIQPARDRPANRRKPESTPAPESNEARMKFASAKAISSDITSISSADLFGEADSVNPGAGVSLGNVIPSADITHFKQGVKSVAGKMAVLA
ncbi:hypothetical protein GDO78_021218, partial [Eleutherodactylus coqui]